MDKNSETYRSFQHQMYFHPFSLITDDLVYWMKVLDFTNSFQNLGLKYVNDRFSNGNCFIGTESLRKYWATKNWSKSQYLLVMN